MNQWFRSVILNLGTIVWVCQAQPWFGRRIQGLFVAILVTVKMVEDHCRKHFCERRAQDTPQKR